MREALGEFFRVNQPLVYFAYGLVFFVLGLAILLQSRSRSRLSIARRLKWLAMFGLIHGLHEWGDLFIPMQAAYLARSAYDLLLVLHQVLLVTSFACLFQFAIALLRPLPQRWSWARWLPAGAVAIWTVAALLLLDTGPATQWAVRSSIAARYAIGLPAALLAGTALIRQAPRLIAPLDDPATVRTLRRMGIALLAYAVAAGLIVPRGEFFPANVLNTGLVEAATALPVPVLRGLIAGVLVVAVARMLDLFNLELDRTLGAVEEAQVLDAERARLGRDLHDRTLQAVYAAGLVLSACFETERRKGRTEAAESLARAMLALDRAIEDLREHIAMLRSPPATVSLADGLVERMRASAVEAVATPTLRVDLPEELRLEARTVGHVLAIASEALSNVARHSGATQVSLTALVDENRLVLEIVDDGRGLPVDYVSGFGIQNMHERARLVNGDLQILTIPSRGTRLRLVVPLKDAEHRGRR